MDLGLQEKVVLVTGSSGGIGKGIAASFLGEGAIVYINGRNSHKLRHTCDELSAMYGKRVNKSALDLSKLKNVKSLINRIKRKNGRLDVVVANIGSGKSFAGWDVPDIEFKKSIETNLYTSIMVSRESIKVMEKQKKGAIIFISSICGVDSLPAPVPYSVAKAGLNSYVKNTSDIVAKSGIRMNVISPGNIYFKGGTWDKKLKENKRKVKRFLEESVPLSRFGYPEEIGDAAAFLASDRAGFIVGSNLIVDGGQVRTVI